MYPTWIYGAIAVTNAVSFEASFLTLGGSNERKKMN